MSMSLKYAMKNKAKGMCEHGKSVCEMCHGGDMMADGGEVEPSPTPKPRSAAVDAFIKGFKGSFPGAEASEDGEKKADGGLVDGIMRKRYSKGGEVANDSDPIADSESAEYDDLVKDDTLAFHETGENSGDDLGDAQEDADRRDIVAAIMKSRKKKDRLPHPG